MAVSTKYAAVHEMVSAESQMLKTQPIGMLGSTLEDDDTLNHGRLLGLPGKRLKLFGSILTYADTFNDSVITLNVESSFLSYADTLNHGYVSIAITGSTLSDTNSFNSGEVISARQLHGSILEDADTFFDSRLGQPMFGSILEDADTLFQGDFYLQIFGSLLKDTNTLNQGNVYPAEILGSLLQDSGNIFGMKIELISVYKILTTDEVVGGNMIYKKTKHLFKY